MENKNFPEYNPIVSVNFEEHFIEGSEIKIEDKPVKVKWEM